MSKISFLYQFFALGEAGICGHSGWRFIKKQYALSRVNVYQLKTMPTACFRGLDYEK